MIFVVEGPAVLRGEKQVSRLRVAIGEADRNVPLEMTVVGMIDRQWQELSPGLPGYVRQVKLCKDLFPTPSVVVFATNKVFHYVAEEIA